MENQILKLLGRKNYLPADAFELHKRLKLQPHEQQKLNRTLRALERSGQVARIKGDLHKEIHDQRREWVCVGRLFEFRLDK